MGANGSKPSDDDSDRVSRRVSLRRTKSLNTRAANRESNASLSRSNSGAVRSKTTWLRRHKYAATPPPPPPPHRKSHGWDDDSASETADEPPPPPPSPAFMSARSKSLSATPVRAERMAPAPLAASSSLSSGLLWVSPRKESDARAFGSNTSSSNAQRRPSVVDTVFVDYTVVPLLLRSGMPYETANGFGEMLRASRTQSQVRKMLVSADALLDALEAEAVEIPRTFAARLQTDRFWEDQADAMSGGGDVVPGRAAGSANKRKSFVYFRNDARAKSLCESAPRAQPLQDAQSLRAMRHRSQFAATRPEAGSLTKADGVELTDAELHRLAELAQQKQRTRPRKALG